MKKITKLLFLPILAALLGVASLISSNPAKSACADSTTPFPRNGTSGTILYVNGVGKHFKNGEADLAIYCYNSESDNAWSGKTDYRVSGDILRVTIPYQNGNSKTWSYFIVTRYDPNKNPLEYGWSGAYNQTENIAFSSMLYAQNVVVLGNYSQGKIEHTFTTYDHYGIRGNQHIYLDLSGFQDWEADGAKFGIYFACPHFGEDTGWGLSYSSDKTYYQSFCWKVKGQDNEHLYECIVPGGSNKIWNLVKVGRFNPVQEVPGWYDCTWNETQNLTFNADNHTANMIHINGYSDGYIDAANYIPRADRVSFYGQYFLDTVQCSGSGASDSTTSEMWNAVKEQYDHLQENIQGDIWTTNGNVSGTTIEQAMARYDYIVLYKKYGHEDFINRKDSPNKTEYPSLVTPIENNIDKQQQIWPVAIIAFAIAMGGLSTLLIIKVRKNKRQ